MPGNRQIYEQAMNMGHSAAWDREWDKAIAAYGRAVKEIPDDPAAHNSLGLALLQARRLEDALKVYTRAHQLAPDDPVPLERSADVLERLGRLKEAAQQYINVAELYLAQRDLIKAIANWERATQLTAGLVHIHQRLALAYEKTGHRRLAIREYLTLAFNFQRANRDDIATQAVERALRLEPNNPQALNTLQAIRTHSPISPDIIKVEVDETGDFDELARDEAFGLADEDLSELFGEGESAAGEVNPRGPLGEALDRALEAVATQLFGDDELDEAGLHASQAISYQHEGLFAEAVGAYERAQAAGLRHLSVQLALGALRLELEQWDAAIPHFDQATHDPHLTAGALHGLSIAQMALNRPRVAARTLIQALRMADMEQAEDEDAAAQIGATYDRLTASAEEADEQQLKGLTTRFLELLSGPSWKERIARTRRQLEEAIMLEEPDSLVSIALYIDDRVAEGLNLIDRFVREGLHSLALDQAHYMLESAPDYLPIHWRIGQILLDRNNIPAAMTKYNLVAETYRLRGDTERAMSILQEALRIAPMDTALHHSLITLLQENERWGDLLSQYIDLADAYYQLADLDAARTTYQSAIQLGQRLSVPDGQIVQILHRLGEIEVNRLDLRQAMRTYDQIRRTDPSDERTRRALVDLNYRLNDPISAVRELDGLLRLYAKQQKAGQIIRVLEELVTRYPNDMALRSRLAAVYHQTGNVPKAVEQLDALAELQLESGLHSDALVTIRRIITLNPEQAQDYQRLLRQLSG
ncbi:MAG: tetratricopeptide repeat protein [Anaerolineae bacterium]|nr:tetratricopeptide repeat protein [Anaerolineae bacterium]MEB2288384.1 tetratricopeptide repeat protein [Anaerolineae bacterium]